MSNTSQLLPDDLDKVIEYLDEHGKLDVLDLLEARENQLHYRKIDTLYQNTGPYRRELYPKHVEFQDASATHSQLAFIAANRTGKTLDAAVIMTYHLTGEYPPEYKGRKFRNPIQAWAAGISNQSTKEVIQEALLGPIQDIGSGTIPKDSIVKMTKKPGVADAVETILVKHKPTGGLSSLTFKAYEQGWESFQGTKKQVVWLDEEPKQRKIYTECITRTMSDVDPGIIMCTFTPLAGMSDVVLSFLPDGQFPENGQHPIEPDKYVVNCGWEDVPHLTEKQKAALLATYSDYEKDARTKGIPCLGSGAIYPFPEDDIFVDPFPIPMWWPKVYALDVGFNCTAALFFARNPETGIYYCYDEYYCGRIIPGHDERLNLPAIHAESIKLRAGDWMWGVIDPAAQGRNPSDGQIIKQMYERAGLILADAVNGVDSGIYRVGQMFMSGRLKIFKICQKTRGEYRVYARDEEGKVIKKNDHAMDCIRYFAQTGIEYMDVMRDPEEDEFIKRNNTNRDRWTGY